jgi:hypothetical protein
LLKLKKNILKKIIGQKVGGGEIKFRLPKCLLKIEMRVSENFRRFQKVEKIHLQAPKKSIK